MLRQVSRRYSTLKRINYDQCIRDHMNTCNNTIITACDRVGYMLHHEKKNIDSRFEYMDKKFEQLDKRFKQMDARLNRIESSIEQLIAQTNACK